MIDSDEGRNKLKQIWPKILKILSFSTDILPTATTSFSSGLDENTNPAHERCFLYNFVA